MLTLQKSLTMMIISVGKLCFCSTIANERHQISGGPVTGLSRPKLLICHRDASASQTETRTFFTLLRLLSSE